MGVNGIYGLSGSGLDVESMVKVGMLSKQSEYDKMQKNTLRTSGKKPNTSAYTAKFKLSTIPPFRSTKCQAV